MLKLDLYYYGITRICLKYKVIIFACNNRCFAFYFFNKMLSFLVKNWAAQFLWNFSLQDLFDIVLIWGLQATCLQLFVHWKSTLFVPLLESMAGIEHRMLIVWWEVWGPWKTVKKWYKQIESNFHMNLIYIVPLVTKWCSKNSTSPKMEPLYGMVVALC